MIHGRIEVPPNEHPAGSMETADESHRDLLAEAWKLSWELKLEVIRVEVNYIDPETNEYPDWEVAGDAVEIDFRSDPPTVVTLPPYSEVAP